MLYKRVLHDDDDDDDDNDDDDDDDEFSTNPWLMCHQPFVLAW